MCQNASMRWILGLVAAIAPAGLAAAQLFTPAGVPIPAVDTAVVSIPPDADAAAAPAGEPQLLPGLLGPAFADVSAIFRRELGSDATSLQAKQYNEQRIVEARRRLTEVAGAYVSARFQIIDVIERAPPSEPPMSASLNRDKHAAAMAAYNRDLAAFEQRKYMAIGTLDLEPSRGGDGLDEATREKIAELRQRMRQIATSTEAQARATPALSKSLRATGRERQNKIQQEIAKLTRESRARGSPHRVYVLGNERVFTEWRQEQQRTVLAVVEQAGVFDKKDRGGLFAEVVLRLVKDEGLTAEEPTSQPTTRPEEE